MSKQHYRIMVPSPTQLDGVEVIDMTAEPEQSFAMVWETAEDAARSLGYPCVIGMRAIKPLITGWLPRQLFGAYRTEQAARERFVPPTRRGN